MFILADDCNYNLLGCYGGTQAKTPNIDRLAREGMRFKRAYAAMAMCAPFRAELYTGLYPARNGVTKNHGAAKSGTRSVCHHLGDLGYRVGICGKRHIRPGSVYPFTSVKEFPAGGSVREFMTADPSQPFCLFLCSSNPHAPWDKGDASQFDRKTLKLAPIQHDNAPTRDATARYLAEVSDLDREVGVILKALGDVGHAEDTLVMFSSEQGWALGFAKWTNWDVGIHTALIARWPGRIKPGCTTDAMVQMCDVVPTFVDIAGGDVAACRMDGASFGKVLAGAATSHRKYVYGMHNNIPEGEPYPIRSIRDGEFHYLMNLTPEAAYHERHVQVANSRLAWYEPLKAAAAAGDGRAKALLKRFHHRPAEELYRPDSDPFELTDLAADPKYADVKARLRKELQRWMAEQGDSGASLDAPRGGKKDKKRKKGGGKNASGEAGKRDSVVKA